MKVVNGIKIAMTNKSLCYKMLLCRIVVYGLFAFPLIFLFSNVLSPFFTGDIFTGLLNDTRNILKNFIMMEAVDGSAYKSAVFNTVSSIIAYIFSMDLKTFLFFIAGILVLQVIKFFNYLCDYAIAVNIN